jgi:hypothetical protein
MATIHPLIAKILIQIGADEPKEIGTIEIPINVTIPSSPPGITYPTGTRGDVA